MIKILFFFILTAFYCNVSVSQVPLNSSNKSVVKRNYNDITGILGAFPDEINLLLTQVKQKKERSIQNILFIEGILNNRRVVIAQTGIGKVNAAITTTLMVEHFSPQQIIFTGIAGGINPELSPGDLVIGSKVAHHDYGTVTPDSMIVRPTRNPSTMLENPVYFKCDSMLILLSEEAGKSIKLEQITINHDARIPKVIKGIIVTGDVFVSSEKTTEHLRTRMNAEATEMEGAAVAQVCYQQKQPFIVIRSISDNANTKASHDIRSFYQVAANNSASLVMAIVKSIAK
ncbi:5'-methylthioadenosine/adenosylhomocysteine nucleosidase [Chryseosolibacter indicus]|uniref:adenosylhomocysteine nucleosidase n=1 Tax=Chryseosolibacter indicus TaxID=2782351 RepID=A0ABS5VPR0_9BACT|nr:5'-methylthioadenosine/adenosylhomocysteine nucleosidase [Chryseosolibacter indicus]MBT1703326.1 5'-methylthioadenosine/adenosylhomocysteine nucleosidase [Chryseosolibacter indicus]